jgi:hypothetical protein
VPVDRKLEASPCSRFIHGDSHFTAVGMPEGARRGRRRYRERRTRGFRLFPALSDFSAFMAPSSGSLSVNSLQASASRPRAFPRAFRGDRSSTPPRSSASRSATANDPKDRNVLAAVAADSELIVTFDLDDVRPPGVRAARRRSDPPRRLPGRLLRPQPEAVRAALELSTSTHLAHSTNSARLPRRRPRFAAAIRTQR